MSKNIYQELLEQKNHKRQLGAQNIHVEKNRKIIDFTSNDYLGVNHNTQIKAELQSFLSTHLLQNQWQIGATGSRLISGNSIVFENFERDIASAKHQSAALIFNSGYQANSTVLAALLKPAGTYVFCDKFNHASLHHACHLAGIIQQRYPHLNYDILEKKLQQTPITANKWIVTETVFGMDGDSANLLKIIALAKKYQAHIYLDEAHATGIFGLKGYGLSTQHDFLQACKELNFNDNNQDNNPEHKLLEICVMGTFGKAIGTAGAYIATSSHLKDYLINYCTGFIYSTAASPLLTEISHYIWQKIPILSHIYAPKILENAAYFRRHLIKIMKNHQWKCQILGDTHIVVLRMQSATTYHLTALKDLYSFLKKHHIYPSIILPPTSSLPSLRFAICAMHELDDIQKVLEVLEKYLLKNVI